MIENSILEIGNEVLKQVNIVDIVSAFIKVTKKGKDYVAICPFHNDTNPSLHISPDKQIFKCFVCGTGGNAIQFVKLYKNCSYIDALKTVCQMAGIKDDRLEKSNFSNNKISEDTKNVYKCLKSIDDYYTAFLYQTEEGKETALKYLYERGLDDETIERFKIGYALKDNEKITDRLLQDGYSLKTIEKTGIGAIRGEKIKDNNYGRVIFTITDDENRVVGFSARQIVENKDQGKYINSPETNGGVFHKSNLLYNYFNAQVEARKVKYVYLVEGFMDAIAIDRAGNRAVLATMGTALTKDHIKLLRLLNAEIRLCLDNDSAGQEAMIKCSKLLKESGLEYCFVSNEQENLGKDCDEILKNHGKDALNKYLNTLITEGEFILNYFARKYDLSSLNNKKNLIEKYIPFLANLNNNIEYELYANKLSTLTGYSTQSIKNEVDKLKRKDEDDGTSYIDLSNDEFVEKKKKPISKELARLENCEKLILTFMLENKDAIKEFDANLGYFNNNVYQEISKLVQEYVSKYSEENYSIANVINFANLYDGINENTRNEMLEEITSISINSINCPPYTKEQMDECIKNIESIKQQLRIKEVYMQTSHGKSLEEQSKNAKRLLEERLKALKGK